MVEYQVDSSGQTIMPSPWEKEEFNAALEWKEKLEKAYLSQSHVFQVGWIFVALDHD